MAETIHQCHFTKSRAALNPACPPTAVPRVDLLKCLSSGDFALRDVISDVRQSHVLIPSIAAIGLMIALFVIFALVSVEPARDPQRVVYMIASIEVQRVAAAIERFRTDTGNFPASLHKLVVNEDIRGWHGPYVNHEMIDPWGRPLVYFPTANSGTPAVVSYGADGKPGGSLFDTDISSLNPKQNIPASPFERRARLTIFGVWISGWLGLVGCIFVLHRTT
ncbi:MAG TPA: type II secretion system protein GspG [Bryobacteraceae bacterium]|nr:type II secretion system protein GspG [Bryobacteraceae bacterium]